MRSTWIYKKSEPKKGVIIWACHGAVKEVQEKEKKKTAMMLMVASADSSKIGTYRSAYRHCVYVVCVGVYFGDTQIHQFAYLHQQWVLLLIH